MKKPCYVYRFKSSSGTKVYETLQYTDGSTSCDCMGWCRRTAPDGSRTCKHVRSVQAGTAQVESQSHGPLGDSGQFIIDHKTTKPPTPTEFKPLKRKLSL